MLIRKLFKYEASHQVFDAYSRRCSHSVHGHSYIVEFIFQGGLPDKAHMLMDFGFVKRYFHPFVDAFDHCHILWIDPDRNFYYNDEYNNFFKNNNERWIGLPFNSTAEMQAKMFYMYGRAALRQLSLRGYIAESTIMHSVKVHETDTGYAEFRDVDYHSCNFPKVNLDKIIISKEIISEWTEEYSKFYNDITKSS